MSMGTPLNIMIVKKWESEKVMRAEGEVMKSHLIIYTMESGGSPT